MKKIFMLISIMLFTVTLNACSGVNTKLVLNPYESIDFETTGRALTNLHTHTVYSDGNGLPHDVVDLYDDLEYDILAITDHDEVTYPWAFSEVNENWEDRNPEDLGMLDVLGNELTVTRTGWFPDTVSLFTDYKYQQPESLKQDPQAFHNTLDELDAIEESLMFIAHPGREWKSGGEFFGDYSEGDMYHMNWWTDLFNDHPLESLIGIEVFNRDDRYPHDRRLWDAILTETMPERPVWGLGNDDYHGDDLSHGIHMSYTTQLMDEPFSEEGLKNALKNGHFFTSNTSNVMDDAPTISTIDVDKENKTITIEGEGYDKIEWFHGTTGDFFESVVVGEGETFSYGSFEGNYVRARLIVDQDGPDEAKTLTQPFGFTVENE